MSKGFPSRVEAAVQRDNKGWVALLAVVVLIAGSGIFYLGQYAGQQQAIAGAESQRAKELAARVADVCSNPTAPERAALDEVGACAKARQVQASPAPTPQDGAQGEQGERGPRGFPGADGANGKDGAPGAKGDKGDPGAEGGAGADGADSTVPGPTGAAGSDGADGAPGADSTVPGPQGERGAPGADGAPGKDGADGQDGAPGRDAYPFSFSFVTPARGPLDEARTYDCTVIDPDTPATCRER